MHINGPSSRITPCLLYSRWMMFKISLYLVHVLDPRFAPLFATKTMKLISTVLAQEREWVTHLEGAAKKTPFSSQYATPIHMQLSRDSPQETGTGYAAKRLLYDQDEQLAYQQRHDIEQDRPWDPQPTKLQPYKQI